MNVIHINPHVKRKILTLPITGNYLTPDTTGQLRWAEPNDSWRVYTHAGKQRMLVSNIRFDDTDHSPDLWIYSILTNWEVKAIKDRVTTEEFGKEPKPFIEALLMNDNRIHLDLKRKWYIRQFVDNQDRTGIRRFAGIPLNAWLAMWRRTIALEDIEIYGLSNGQMKVLFRGLQFNVFFKWEELQLDMIDSPATVTKNGVSMGVSEIIMPWLVANCREGIIPFSDYDTMFPDESDEITYSIDMAAIS
jgi:hypothetical protein